MPLIPLKFPPGVVRNGTPYMSKGRWYDVNLVRWHNGAARPIGGWERRFNEAGSAIPQLVDPADVSIETIRDVITYRDNAAFSRVLLGSNTNVYAIDASGNPSTVTPTGFIGDVNTVINLIGYGIGVYGMRSYGTPRNPADAKPIPVSRWTFQMWGENVVCLFDSEGILYEYIPAATELVPISGAPTGLVDFVVTDERILMGVRNTPNLREVLWSDREDLTSWVDAVDNYAGSFRLGGTGMLQGIYKIQNQILILSEDDAHVATYLGAPFVYGFERIGMQCSAIHKRAVANTERFAVWIGQRNFWVYDGTLRPLECDIMDYVRDTLDMREVSKMFTMTVADYSEVWWFYQSKTGSEVDTYIVYDYVDSTWSFGKLSRTAGVDRSTYASPLMIDPQGHMWNHEQEAVKVTGDAYLMTGPIEIEDGNRNLALRYVFPDNDLPNQVTFDFYSRQTTTAQLFHHGPFPYNNPLPTTGVLGREVYMKITGLTASWKVGTMRFDIQAVGGGFR